MYSLLALVALAEMVFGVMDIYRQPVEQAAQPVDTPKLKSELP